MAAEETLALFYFVFSSSCPPPCTSPCPYPPSHRSSLSWQLLLAAREPFPVVSKEDGFPQVQVSNHKLVVVFHHHPLPTTSYWLLNPSPPPSGWPLSPPPSGWPPLSSCQAVPSCCWWRSSPASPSLSSPSDLANQNIILLHGCYILRLCLLSHYIFLLHHLSHLADALRSCSQSCFPSFCHCPEEDSWCFDALSKDFVDYMLGNRMVVETSEGHWQVSITCLMATLSHSQWTWDGGCNMWGTLTPAPHLWWQLWLKTLPLTTSCSTTPLLSRAAVPPEIFNSGGVAEAHHVVVEREEGDKNIYEH